MGREESLCWSDGYRDDGRVEWTINVSRELGRSWMMLTEKWECKDFCSMMVKPVLLLVQ